MRHRTPPPGWCPAVLIQQKGSPYKGKSLLYRRSGDKPLDPTILTQTKRYPTVSSKRDTHTHTHANVNMSLTLHFCYQPNRVAMCVRRYDIAFDPQAAYSIQKSTSELREFDSIIPQSWPSSNNVLGGLSSARFNEIH